MKAWTRIFAQLIAVSAAWYAVPLFAQQDAGQKPKPAARVLLPLPDLNGDQDNSDQSNQQMQPDQGPVTGVQSPTLGTSHLRHSYWVPGIQYGNTAQSNAFNAAAQNAGWTTTSYANGNLSFIKAWSHSLFGANYSGGGFVSNDKTQGNGQYHQLSSAIELDQRRWQALLIEQFSYLPQSSFLFGGTTGLSVPGIEGALSAPLPGLQEVFVPGQSIFAAIGSRYSSASAAQLSYKLSPRHSITVAAVHGLLRFDNPNNVSNDSEILNAGYNYAITRRDYFGIVYRFTAFHFTGNPQALGDQLVQIMYGRRVTGRLALSVGGGPDLTTFRLPVSGSKQTISGAGIASLTYGWRSSTIGLNYSHGVSNGSGLFSGSRIDQVMATWDKRLNRVWRASLNFGHARNTQIVTISSLTSPSYDSWSAGAGLRRPLLSNTDLSIGYQALTQASNGVLCVGPVCQSTQLNHQILLSVQWHAAPQVLQ